MTLSNVGQEWGRVGRGGSKKSKPIPALPHGAGLKSCPIPVPPLLWGGKNLHRAKREGRVKRDGGKLPYLILEAIRPHVVCIPYPLQGHINPMLKLAKLLHHWMQMLAKTST